MSIAVEKEKQASERFLLARLNPARYILPVLNAGLYEITLPFLINSIRRNGVELTKDISAPGVNDHWYQDESTLVLKVKLASAPNDTTNVLTVNRYLFYTGTISRVISEDPEDSSTPKREWQPRILTYPSTLESFDNITAGVFTINDTSISVINHDGAIQMELTDDDSFYNQAVEMWLCINGVENITKVFTGSIKSLSFDQTTATFKCLDGFSKLQEVASFGDSPQEIRYTASRFPGVDSRYRDKPLPYQIGKISRYLTYEVYPLLAGFSGYLMDKGETAVVVPSLPPSTTNNRYWVCCRQKGPVATQAFGTLQAVLEPQPGLFYTKFSSIANTYVGDTVKWYDGAAFQWGRVIHLGAFTYLGNPYNIVIEGDGGSFSVTHTFSNLKSFSVSLTDNGNTFKHNLRNDRDYVVDDSTVTTGGNRLVQIIFFNNFEAQYTSTVSVLDPNKHLVEYRTSSASPETHSQILLDILDKVDLPVNAATFTAAQAALDVGVQFSVPNFDESDYKTYLKYVQQVLESALSYLTINADFEAEYYLMAAPSSSDVRDSSLMVKDETRLSLDYQDILTSLIAYNPHNSSYHMVNASPSPSETRENFKAKFLHGIDQSYQFRHVLDTITARIDAHMGLKSSRKAVYRFSTATEDIDTALGSDLELRNKIVLGTTPVQDVKIVTIEKSPSKTTIEASDFKGL